MSVIIRKPTEQERSEAASWPIWEKEPSTFPWNYEHRETCLILEGEATVEAGSEKFSFGAGDYVVFPEGLACTWHISKSLRKHYRFG